MYFTTIDGQRLYYEVHGNSNSVDTIVFLNGLDQTLDAWKSFLGYFENDFKIILLDFIFQGSSDKQGSRDFNDHSRDVKGLLDHLKIDKVFLIGISYGSIVAYHVAMNFPWMVKRLVLLSTFAHKTTAYFKSVELAWNKLKKVLKERTEFNSPVPEIMSQSLSEVSNNIKKLSARNYSFEELHYLGKLMHATILMGDKRESLRGIITPVLVIHGEKDNLVELELAKAAADCFPDSVFVIIPGGGHDLNLDSVAEVTREIKKFLKD